MDSLCNDQANNKTHFFRQCLRTRYNKEKNHFRNNFTFFLIIKSSNLGNDKISPLNYAFRIQIQKFKILDIQGGL